MAVTKQKGPVQSASKEVATPKKTGGVVAPFAGMEGDAGSGLEQAKGREHLAIPFLYILQGLSPAVTEGRDGAKPGRIINSVTGEIFDEILVIPVRYSRTFVEWVPRDNGGGFRGEFPEHEREEEFKNKRDSETGRCRLDNGNDLADTRNFYVLLADENTGTTQPAIISMTSTQIKKARTWLTIMNLQKMEGKDGKPFTPAMYAHVFKLSTQPEENKKGRWHGWKIERVGFIDDSNQYEQGKLFNQQVTAGLVTMDRSQTEAEAEASKTEAEDL
jgi:hypothetical protein